MSNETLKILAERAYVCGLETIGEAAAMTANHYDAFWLIEEAGAGIEKMYADIAGHEGASWSAFLTAEEVARIDRELDAELAYDPAAPEEFL